MALNHIECRPENLRFTTARKRSAAGLLAEA
jgi:hypothetical protein